MLMRPPVSLCSAALAALLVFRSATAFAEPSAAFAAAESAYSAIDFDGTRTAAENALNEGNHDPTETLRLYTLLGIATSALGQDSEAREAFRRVIAIDPNTDVDKTLSPKIRSPYLEVRGELSAKGKLTPLSANVVRRAGRLFVELNDPAAVAASIDVAYRAGSSSEVTHFHLVRGQETRGSNPVSDASRVEYALTLRDGYGNALFRAGSNADPEVLSPAPSALTDTEHSTGTPKRTPYYVTAGLLAAAGVGAGAAAVYFHVQREKEAHDWNGPSCEQPGATRAEQCASVDSQRQKDQNLAIGLYAASGALLLGSVITLLVTPSAPRETARPVALPCVPGVGTFGASCRFAF
jgi:hypothetical protein